MCEVPAIPILRAAGEAKHRKYHEHAGVHALGLTRKSSGAAGGSERGLQRKCFHNLSGGIGTASGCSEWLDLGRAIQFSHVPFFSAPLDPESETAESK